MQRLLGKGTPIRHIANILECEAYRTSIDCLRKFLAGR